MAIDACDAIYSVHGTIFDPINSALDTLEKSFLEWYFKL